MLKFLFHVSVLHVGRDSKFWEFKHCKHSAVVCGAESEHCAETHLYQQLWSDGVAESHTQTQTQYTLQICSVLMSNQPDISRRTAP